MKTHNRNGLTGIFLIAAMVFGLFGGLPPARAELDVVAITKAAEQGDADAQFELGFMYSKGKGVPQDDKQAVNWTRKAAEQGYVSAQYNLSLMYEDGKGVPQDDQQAVNWYRKAAEQGDVDAQYNLSVMYAHGKGVPQDDIYAYAWSSLAAAQGDKDAIKNRDVFANRLTPEQRSKAQELAVELEAKIDHKKP